MSPPAIRTLAVTAIAAAATGVAALGASARPSDPGATAAAKRITARGVDGVRIGKRFRVLRAAGLVGALKPGCELGGPQTRSAKLKKPLRGSVNFTLTNPRRVTDITIRHGAKARGVGVGARIPRILNAFPKAKVDHSNDGTLGVTLVRVPKKGGGDRMMFAVDVNTHKTTLIGVPSIALCE
jgi:hypothetical protein